MVQGDAEIMISGKPYPLLGGEMILMAREPPAHPKALMRFKIKIILKMIRS